MTCSNRKSACILCFALISLCCFTGCQSSAGSSGAGGSSKDIEKTMEPAETKTGSENKELKIYSINYDTDEVEDSVAYISADEEISVRVVADAVIEGFDDYGIDVRINDAVVENGNAVVDFKKYEDGQGIFKEPTKKVEETVLNCISYSILDNIPEVQGIIFRIDGQAYQTDNFSFEENQVYDKR